MAITNMVNRARRSGIDATVKLYGNALVHRSRNIAVAGLPPDADYALFLDDDMLPEPDALIQLASHQVPVVSAFCTTRGEPVAIAAKKYDPATDQFVALEALRPDTLVSGQYAVGAAFCLFHRDVIEALRDYYLSAQDWLDANARLLCRLGAKPQAIKLELERKQELRRRHWEKERYLRIFDFPVTDDELQLGEDIGLSRSLIKLSIPVAIDTSVAVGHLGEYPYGPWDLGKEEHRDDSGH